ncbi:hypothetical protein H9Y04_40990 [Streptomyces sp. TRM66268-LWL]|uniref:Uncharacterized protein n=1 Tax=Streptomyces polyasparticus TaxID=2767826 RepID=A0ABR7SVI0_9ACTN|nr:hypothetical protein [Streptomyces polyasparticus]MBC9718922.1 hypothetical protein [Streptomyces polyasparticus]
MTAPPSPRRPGVDALARLGHGVHDLDAADASPYTFPDDGIWRTEISSVEGPEALAVVLKESSLLDVPVHRISQGSGVWMLSDAEIIGCHEDALRATELGVKCLLIADEDVLWALHRARLEGIMPADTTLKVSALIGPVNPASYAVFEQLGADSLNVPSDLTLDHCTEIRRVSSAPSDMYVEAPDDLGGHACMYEIAELIRRGAPVYLKFGLSKAPGIHPYGAHLRDLTLDTARERVRRGRLALDLLARNGADDGMSPPGSRQPGRLRRFTGGC